MHIKDFKMAASRSLLLIVLLGLVCSVATVVRADDGIPPSYEYGNEIVALKSKLTVLEEGLKNKELTLSEKESKINQLEQELDALRTRKEETGDTKLAELKIDSAMSKVRELESQVKSLQEEADKLRVEADLHANRAKTVEDTATGHLTEKEKAIKALEDQKVRLQKAERGLQIAEAAMLKAKAEAEEKAKRLDDLHKAWLPPWAATHAETLTKTASDRWSTHAEPVVKNLHRSASSRAADAHEYIKPHLETFHTKVNPLIKEKWQKLAAAAAPHLETVKKAGVSSREYIAPHVETVQKVVNPYVEAVRVKSKPYVDQAKTLAAPHLERVNTVAGPHYRRALAAANSYHEQVQSHLTEKLGQYKVLSSLATKEFIWFLAAALLALPFVIVFMFLRSLFVPKPVVHHKRHRSSHSGSSTSKKPRRSRQADKQEQK
jgi:hypothetical protein